ncbi:TPA: hypothetical protein ANIA_11288 [Aspergillus nidulans FGSC A4]|uniref:Uncharacterized protein n=1 Tax=Emericella nidulans (strain FGSC A4 / ATCC 38163 / CBS 112.46 / NRRL 194 / M139) TaxID=227321 RepID=C8VTX4_EMENI|nr:TPA: hypothetical protein ANIA_11288 [Aspergillus nidulans FGSC A4]
MLEPVESAECEILTCPCCM